MAAVTCVFCLVLAFYYGRRIEKLSGYETKLKWDPVPWAEKELMAILVSGVASLSFILLGALTESSAQGALYSLIGVSLFVGVVIPVGNRIARMRHKVNRGRLPPSKQKAADEIFEILVYGNSEKEKKEKRKLKARYPGGYADLGEVAGT